MESQSKSRLAALAGYLAYSCRLYVAPLTGAVRGIRAEIRRIERREQRRRRELAAGSQR